MRYPGEETWTEQLDFAEKWPWHRWKFQCLQMVSCKTWMSLSGKNTSYSVCSAQFLHQARGLAAFILYHFSWHSTDAEVLFLYTSSKPSTNGAVWCSSGRKLEMACPSLKGTRFCNPNCPRSLRWRGWVCPGLSIAQSSQQCLKWRFPCTS